MTENSDLPRAGIDALIAPRIKRLRELAIEPLLPLESDRQLLLAVADQLDALGPAPRRPPVDQALDALAFAEGALYDAIGLEDGLDGRAGDAVIELVRQALIANGRTPISRPTGDDDQEWFRAYLASRLADLDQIAPRRPQEPEQGERTDCGVLSGAGSREWYACVRPHGHDGQHLNKSGHEWGARRSPEEAPPVRGADGSGDAR